MVKVIKTVVAGEGGRANRMDTEGNVYLPIHMGYRICYYRYMDMESLGYTVTVCLNRTLTVVEEDPTTNTNDEEQRDYLNLQMYWTKWKMLYPRMKVSCPAEDICGNCFTFANRHRILSSRQSGMQQEQEQQETTLAGDGKDERELIEMLNSISLDIPGAACTKIKEAKENLIRECSLHIEMARAQRLLYQILEKAAVDDAQDAVDRGSGGKNVIFFKWPQFHF